MWQGLLRRGPLRPRAASQVYLRESKAKLVLLARESRQEWHLLLGVAIAMGRVVAGLVCAVNA